MSLPGTPVSVSNHLATQGGVTKFSQHGSYYSTIDPVYEVSGPEGPVKMVDLDVALETVFELIRQSDFPHHPSRLGCSFAWSSKEEAKSFSPMGDVYEVKTSGRTLRVDMNWVSVGNSADSLVHNARQYWSQKPMPGQKPAWEILIEVPASVGSLVL